MISISDNKVEIMKSQPSQVTCWSSYTQIKTVDTELNVDLVEIYVSGSSLGSSTLVGVISGQSNVPTSYVSPNNRLIVRLSVDGTVGGGGWTGTWATRRSTYCGLWPVQYKDTNLPVYEIRWL